MQVETLNYDQVHALVDAAGPNVFWDGYTVVSWRQNPNGQFKSDGMRRNGKWGVARRIDFDSSGLWRIPTSVRHTR